MKHEWMRQKHVDISQYLPAFLNHSQRFKATNQADSREHENVRVDLQDTFDQLFVQSATWGIERWEELLAITSQQQDSIEVRRKRVLDKLQSKQSSTKAFMRALAAKYFDMDAEVDIEEDNPNYAFSVVAANGFVKNIAGLIRDVETYKPAHLGYKVRQHMNVNHMINFAFVRRIKIRSKIYPLTMQQENELSPEYIQVFEEEREGQDGKME